MAIKKQKSKYRVQLRKDTSVIVEAASAFVNPRGDLILQKAPAGGLVAGFAVGSWVSISDVTEECNALGRLLEERNEPSI